MFARPVLGLVAKAMTSKMILCALAAMVLSTNCTGNREAPLATCKGGTVNAGDLGRMEYRFKADINQVRPLSIEVDFYPDVGGYEKVVECFWIPGEKYTCITLKGYSLHALNSHEVELRVFNVSEMSAGAYVAQLMAPDDKARVSCQLKVIGRVAPEPAEPTPRVTDSTADSQAGKVTPPPTRNSPETNAVTRTSKGGETTAIAVAVSVIAVVVGVVIAAVCFVKRRRRKGKQQRKEADEESNAGSPRNEEPSDAHAGSEAGSPPTPRQENGNAPRSEAGRGEATSSEADSETGQEETASLLEDSSEPEPPEAEGPVQPCSLMLQEIRYKAIGMQLRTKKMVENEVFPWGDKKKNQELGDQDV